VDGKRNKWFGKLRAEEDKAVGCGGDKVREGKGRGAL